MMQRSFEVMLRRGIVLILSVFLLSSLSIMSVHAERCGEEITISDPIIYTDPFCADDPVPEIDLANKQIQNSTQSVSEETYTTVEEAGAFLRQEMVDREENVVVNIAIPRSDTPTADRNRVWREVLNSAFEHTGNPIEGDYLRWHSGAVSSSGTSYTFEDDVMLLHLKYTAAYYSTLEQEQELTAAIQSLLQELNLEGKSDYEKVRLIYDYICQNVTYDYDNLNDDTYVLKRTAYAALINHTAVCQGYANLFYRLLMEAGINNRIIAGKSRNETHAWNNIKLDDLYYNADSTWDAGRISYNYFLRCNDYFTDHVRGNPSTVPGLTIDYESEEFNAAYPMSLMDYGDTAIMIYENNTYDISLEAGESCYFEFIAPVFGRYTVHFDNADHLISIDLRHSAEGIATVTEPV